MEISFINMIRRSVSARVQHSIREGNPRADYFANLVFRAGAYLIRNGEDVPSEGRKILYLDKQGIPHIRRTVNH